MKRCIGSGKVGKVTSGAMFKEIITCPVCGRESMYLKRLNPDKQVPLHFPKAPHTTPLTSP